MKKHITALAVGTALALNAQAESWFDFEAGVGGALYGKAPNGLWWQEGFQHNLQLAAPAFEVGFAGNIYQSSHWGVDWHADWVWLGMTHYDAMVPSPYTNTTSGHWEGADFVGYNAANPCNGPCTNLTRFVGGGHDQGFLLSLEPHIDYGGWRLGIEGGPYLHSSTWSEDLYGWFAPGESTPSNLHVEHAHRWVLGYMVGVSAAYKNVSLAVQYFSNKRADGDPTPPPWTGTWLAVAKYRF